MRIIPRVTERSFYPELIDIIRSKGGQAVSEIMYQSEPDIQFELGNRTWLLSVKIGENPKIIKDALLQYLRHKDDSGIKFGLILFLPDLFRKIEPAESAIRSTLRRTKVTTMIDADLVKDELADRPFPEVIDYLIKEVLLKLERKQSTYYPFPRVISLLQQQVADMMAGIHLDEKTALRVITDKHLLMDLGHMHTSEAEATAYFLAAFIFLNQILFLRLLVNAQPDKFSTPITPVTHNGLRTAFGKVCEINYRPIYEIDVLDAIPKEFLEDTFKLIWGLEVEKVQHELPGRIFHELMPSKIRKMLAAFYTRPYAADILAHLTIEKNDATVFDPACGSGTILVSAYNCKMHLSKKEGIVGNPHRRFAEKELFGADIMPFAVHLTSANIAAIDPAVTIERTQIIQGNSLELASGVVYSGGIQLGFFVHTPMAKTVNGDPYAIKLNNFDAILMNPPFTKIERGIKAIVEKMDRFKNKIGGEVGLWGHFIGLADVFLKEEGTFGGVIPINVLRGRESASVRKIVFEEWTPLYILKPTYNYGFSEWSEYRDILLIARKQKPEPDHKVKFCLVKKDLTKITQRDIKKIAEGVKKRDTTRDDELVDIDSHPIKEIKERMNNLMWFCGVTDFNFRDKITAFLEKFNDKLLPFPANEKYFQTGLRTYGRLSKILFLTRRTQDARIEQAFLHFLSDLKTPISAQTLKGTTYKIPKSKLIKSLRTPVGINQMDMTFLCDYIVKEPYTDLERVCKAADVSLPKEEFWDELNERLKGIESYIAVSRRLNPFSPANHHFAFFAARRFSPSDQLNVILEENSNRAQAICAVLNSIIFHGQFFLLKEESTGRYVDIRLYDLEEMRLIPSDKTINLLVNVFRKYGQIEFPALSKQFDRNFSERYEEFWDRERLRKGNQQRLWTYLDKPINPFPDRLKFDLAVCKALGVPVTKEELLSLYEIIVKEMILIKGLKRD
ncbi:N-6 DNA methylase [bacterium]|nr:N-6 DNA methylase [bacterium]